MELGKPYFHNDEEARKFLESRLWPTGPLCPHCGETRRVYPSKGKGVRPGVYRCNNPKCDRDFTVTIGTIMESSHVPLRKWLLAIYLFSTSKKGISSKQLQRMLGGSY